MRPCRFEEKLERVERVCSLKGKEERRNLETQVKELKEQLTNTKRELASLVDEWEEALEAQKHDTTADLIVAWEAEKKDLMELYRAELHQQQEKRQQQEQQLSTLLAEKQLGLETAKSSVESLEIQLAEAERSFAHQETTWQQRLQNRESSLRQEAQEQHQQLEEQLGEQLMQTQSELLATADKLKTISSALSRRCLEGSIFNNEMHLCEEQTKEHVRELVHAETFKIKLEYRTKLSNTIRQCDKKLAQQQKQAEEQLEREKKQFAEKLSRKEKLDEKKNGGLEQSVKKFIQEEKAKVGLVDMTQHIKQGLGG